MPPLRLRILPVLVFGAILAGIAPASASTSSAFLQALAGSPVHWQPWNAETLKQAREAGKPVYVFIGAFTSELSRATCRQTLSNAETAAYLNDHFTCIAVDRDEQPDVAALAQHYLRTVAQADGWPAHLWFTPEMQPFEGAGYLPPTEEWGKPGFSKVMQKAGDAWAASADSCRKHGEENVAALAKPLPVFPSGASLVETSRGRLSTAADTWRGQFDATNGGFGEPPKSPEPELVRFLLSRGGADRDAALATLRAIATSAMCDPLDGGVFHSASDAAWKMPYPQKTLAEQARFALAFLDGASAAGDDAALVRAARGALDYALTRLAQSDGTFAAAEDASGDDHATYYTWTTAEIEAVLGQGAAAYEAAHGVQPDGNVPEADDLTGQLKGRNFLRPAAKADAAGAAASAKLLAARDARPAILRDTRATAGAHGLLLAALARAGAQLKEPRYLEAAAKLRAIVEKTFVASPAGALRRLPGEEAAASPTDYALVALGCRELAQAASDAKAAALADRLLARARAEFFVTGTDRYYAVPAALPAGFVVRPPALVETPSAEAAALLAGVPADDAHAIAAALLVPPAAEDAAPAGDTLLALSKLP